MPTNPWAPWLRDFPESAFRALIPTQGSNTFLDFVRGSFPRFQQELAGAEGRLALAGRDPFIDPVDFLRGNEALGIEPFGFTQRFGQLSPTERGFTPQRFAPRTRFIR